MTRSANVRLSGFFLSLCSKKNWALRFKRDIQFSQVVEQVLQQIESDVELNENSLLVGEILLDQLG